MNPQEASMRPASETDILHALKAPEMSSSHLKELVSVVYQYHKIAGGPLRVFPKGIPVPDTIRATFTANSKTLLAIVERVVTDGRVINLDTFPLGIPKPDLFEVNVEFR